MTPDDATPDERCLAAVWPFVRSCLPTSPAGVLEIGCGPARFDRQLLTYGPYFFPDLAGITERDEQAAIDAGAIQANRISYAGRRR